MALLEDLLITVLFGTQASFTHPGVLLPPVESTSDTELKNVVKETQRSRTARETLGYSQKVWKAMTETLRAGCDQLQQNKHHLLPKVWDLAILARNLLAAKEKAQNLAAQEGFDAEIRRLLSICVEKTSKPIPAGLEKTAHDKEMQMKGGYKKVLITSLQFLNNLMTGNESRKLHVWLHLFGTPSSVSPASAEAGKKKGQGKAAGKGGPAPESAAAPNENYRGPGFIPVGPGAHTETAAKCNMLSAGFNAKYYRPGFLTEVPRLLQPDEIEPLLMVLQSGIVAFDGADTAMQAVRTKLMLAQGYGRSLLREVLVFLGAWEVEEDDFCYRVLAQIVEAILNNGLLPYAYECFRDDKDIVTPAQSVLVKLLVSVYRPPQAHPQPPPSDDPAPHALPAPYDEPPLIDPSIPTFFINVFRKQMIDPIIRIIDTQGLIRTGKLKKELFEYSLWDLDRIYEGLYQYVEIFTLFSEDEHAKKIMLGTPDHGLIVDFVRLLRSLNNAIPRYIATKAGAKGPNLLYGKPFSTSHLNAKPQPNSAPAAAAAAAVPTAPPQPQTQFMVERPFDISSTASADEYDDSASDLDPDRELVEPDEFSWPNIKRFMVILIAALAWNNRSVQDAVREHGGIHVVLNQCKVDDDNPYIREHAILCVRALLQGNAENQECLRELEERGVEVPSEVKEKGRFMEELEPWEKENLAKKGKGTA